MLPLPECNLNGGSVRTTDKQTIEEYFFKRHIDPHDILFQSAGTREERLTQLTRDLGVDLAKDQPIEETTFVDRDSVTIINHIRVYETRQPGVYFQAEWDPKTFNPKDLTNFQRSSLRRLGMEAEREYYAYLSTLQHPRANFVIVSGEAEANRLASQVE